MKAKATLIATLTLCILPLRSEETINQQIETIQKAPPQERSELMNKLKTQLATMNENERSHTINSLQTRMGENMASPKGIQNLPSNLPRINQIQTMQQNIIQQNIIQQRSRDTINAPLQRMRR